MRTFLKKLIMIVSCLIIFLGTTNIQAASAPKVTSVNIVKNVQDANGNVTIVVRVNGYGKAPYATYGGIRCNYSSQTSFGRPIVSGYEYTYKLGKALPGRNEFYFQITSQNYPWNTMSTSCYIDGR